MNSTPLLFLALAGILCPALSADEGWDEAYSGSVLPESGEWPWSVAAGPNTTAESAGTCLRIADTGRAKGELRLYTRQWQADPSLGGVVEARLKVLSCSGPSGVILMAADGAQEAALTFYPDRIEAGSGGACIRQLDTAGGFHTYRLELTGTRVRVAVDGQPLIDEPIGVAKPAYHGRNLVGFGSCSSPATGEALWEFVRFRALSPSVNLPPGVEHRIVYKQPGVYACFPSLLRLPDGSLHTTFGTRTRRSHIDGTGGGAAYVSRDGGLSWSRDTAKATHPLYLRKDGGLTYASAYGWREVPKQREAEFRQQGLTVRDVRPDVVAYLSGAYAFLRRGDEDQGKRTPVPVPSGLSLMNYNSAALCVTRNGVRLHAVYGRRSGSPNATSFVLRSADDGESWDLLPIAGPVKSATGDTIGFDETAVTELPDGRILALMRPDPDRHGFLWQAESCDAGKTWSLPVMTPMWGYPAHLLPLRDGRLLSTYGYRKAPMGIRACLSRDGGHTWDIERELVLRADGKRSGSDLGYPLTTELDDGSLLSIYYFTCADGITHIATTRWRAE